MWWIIWVNLLYLKYNSKLNIYFVEYYAQYSSKCLKQFSLIYISHLFISFGDKLNFKVFFWENYIIYVKSWHHFCFGCLENALRMPMNKIAEAILCFEWSASECFLSSMFLEIYLKNVIFRHLCMVILWRGR